LRTERTSLHWRSQQKYHSSQYQRVYFGKSAYPCSLYRNDFIRHWQITADAADRGAGADLEFVRALNAGLE
jgi:hypothetical protein